MSNQYAMTRWEKIKITLSLFGVALLTVVAYWAQTPASDLRSDNFRADVISLDISSENNPSGKPDSFTDTGDGGSLTSSSGSETATADSTRLTSLADSDPSSGSAPSPERTVPTTDEDLYRILGINSDSSTETAAAVSPETLDAALETGISPLSSSPATEFSSMAESVSSPIDAYSGRDEVPYADFTDTSLGRGSASIDSTLHGSAISQRNLPQSGLPLAAWFGLTVFSGLGAVIARKTRK